jgi:hypothetical protein
MELAGEKKTLSSFCGLPFKILEMYNIVQNIAPGLEPVPYFRNYVLRSLTNGPLVM